MSEEISDSLIGIELTKEGRILPKEFDIITDNERTEVLADPARAAIIGILRNGINDTLTTESTEEKTGDRIIRQNAVKRHALSVTEISRLSKNPEISDIPLTNSQIYHHLPKLIDYNYVIKYGTVTRGKRKTDYYRRTAMLYVFDRLPGFGEGQLREKVVENVDQLSSFFNFNLPEEKKNELIELRLKVAQIEHETYSKLMKMVRTDVANSDVLHMFDDLISTHSIASEEWISLRKRMHEILFEP
ncbi:MAG: hypothetical protein ACFE7R_02515 [Candidatus Hodarchaeota archaeon]